MEKFVGLVDFSGHSAQTARSNALARDLDIYRAAQATIKAPGEGCGPTCRPAPRVAFGALEQYHPTNTKER